MKNIKLYLILLALLTIGQAKAQGLTGSGTTDDPYLISSNADWTSFAQSVTNGTTYAGQIVKLTNDISITTTAGIENKCFAGTFDGQGHTITLNMSAGMQFTSLICYADGATFQNLKVDGTINTSKKFCAGFVGAVINNGCTFTNCVSDVTINSSISGDGTHGGLVAYVGKGNNTFEGCAFTGKLLGSNTNYVGGLVGFTDSRNSATVSFTNCVFHPQQVTMSGNGSQTFARWYGNNSGSVTIGDNCYYSQTLGGAQGKQMRSITGGNYVTVAFSGNATTYERSGISAYSVGIVFNSTLYAGNGDTVSLNLSCTPPSGYVCSGYTASAGTLTGTANPYTLTMPNETVTIQAVLVQSATPVSYMDGDGTEYTCNYYTVLTGGGATTLAEGWYVVDDDITYTGTLTLEGNVNLILCDGKTMMVNPDSGDGIFDLYEGYALTVYGQTLDSLEAGTLYVTNYVEEYAAIELGTYNQHSGNVVVDDSNDETININGDFTINGGTVNATGFNGISAYNLTLNGGIVNATVSGDGISCIYLALNDGTINATSTTFDGIAANHMTLNGGSVNVTGNRFGINSYNVTINGGTVTANDICSPTVTLGWSNLTDRITVGNFFNYLDTPTVSVKSGQAFCYQNGGEPVIVSGTLSSEEIEAIGGKTLVPYSLAPVTYVDGNGTEHTCTYYTVLEGGEATTLWEGWYVVDDDITYTGTLTLAGNVTLILCNGKTMTVNPDSGNSIIGAEGCTLTVYGQTLDSVTEGTLQVINDVGSKEAIDLSTYTQHSGNVTVNDSNDHAILASCDFILNGGTVNSTGYYGICGYNVTINGGTVNATSRTNGINANNMTINGGTVNASASDDDGVGISANNVTINGGIINTNGVHNGIFARENIILGWTNPDDHILASSYQADGTVSVKSGQAFYYQNGGETVIVSDTLNEEQIGAIGGKTLVPYAPVAYIDENGVQQYCISYTVVNNNLDFDNLPAGWYVVSKNITINRQVHFSGDAHLILCDSAAMNIREGDGISLGLYTDNITLYGQSEGTGCLTDSVGLYTTNLTLNGGTVTVSGYGIYSDNVTINGGTVTATSINSSGISAENVTINGGTVTTNEIFSPTVSLGWSNTTDRITVGNFDYDNTPTVSVKSGQAFYYLNGWDKNYMNPVVISGTLTAEEIAAIAGKTLRPYIEPCATPFDLEVTDIEATTATLHWIGGAEEYEVMYEAVGEKATREVSTGYNHSVVISGLTPNTTYEWKVRGINSDCDGGYTEWSETATFTTFDACPAPSELSSTATHNQATLSWTGFQESFNVRYRMLERAVGWVVVTANTTTLDITDLEPETTYLWQVRGINCDDNGNLTEWSEIASFTTLDACATPFNLEVTNISATTATLHWTGAQESYNVRYRMVARAGEWDVVTANTTTLNLTDLEPETEYEWEVQGIDCDGNGGTTEWSEIATFTTLEGINFAVTGYGQDNGGYYLIASPFSETNPLNITNMLSGNHDLYAFVPNPSDSLEWRNYATDTFNLIAGKGYLYANADTVTLTFSGTPYSGNGEFALVYDSTDARKCWNLVGNPFPCAAYLDRPYYVLNADGTGINPEPIQPTTPIPPCTAVFVKAVGVNDRAVFSVTAP